jgi:hypothetical protein
MKTVLRHKDANIEIEKLLSGKNRINVELLGRSESPRVYRRLYNLRG